MSGTEHVMVCLKKLRHAIEVREGITSDIRLTIYSAETIMFFCTLTPTLHFPTAHPFYTFSGLLSFCLIITER